MEKETKEFEPRFTVGLVLHCNLDALAKIKHFLDEAKITVVYQKTVGRDKKLMIKEEESDKNETK